MTSARSWARRGLRRRSSLAMRAAVLVAAFLFLCFFDYLQSPLTDPLARSGGGYPHQYIFPRNAPYVDATHSWRRVLFNFRRFGHWWLHSPETEGRLTFTGLLTSDGNTVSCNVLGHFVGALVLGLVGLALVPSTRLIFALGTAFNVFHEYIASGRYLDPSFIDLWLGELGLLLALAAFRAAHSYLRHRRHRRHQHRRTAQPVQAG